MWPNPQETADLFTFTEEILNGKLHILYSVISKVQFIHDGGPYHIRTGFCTIETSVMKELIVVTLHIASKNF